MRQVSDAQETFIETNHKTPIKIKKEESEKKCDPDQIKGLSDISPSTIKFKKTNLDD